jgi:hypothetical protein
LKSLQGTVETKFTLSDQFPPLQKTQTRKEELPANPSTGTVPNEAQPIAKSFFTRVKSPKEEAPSQLRKQFDESTNNRNLFNELSTDEIIANSTEIDENEFEGSGQEVKLDDSVVKLISTVSAQQQPHVTFVNESTQNCTFDLVFVTEGNGVEEQLSVARKIIDRIPEALIPGQVRPFLVLNGKVSAFE